MNATFPTMIIAIAWMLLLGWGFQALLKRHLRLDDRLADLEAQLDIEQHARSTAERALADTHASLCQLARQQEAVREAERRRIGRDIHDDLGQHLMTLRVDLSLLHVTTSGAHPQITQKVSGMMDNLDQTIACLRGVINDLRPQALSAGLASAIASQLEDLTRTHHVAHTLRAEPGVFDCGPDEQRDAAVFRIFQETLSNVARHAHATEVQVDLQRCGGVLTISVRDNGVGMPAAAVRRGSGLSGIGERALAIGGRFVIESKPGVGTLARLSYPVPQAYAVH